MISPRWQRVPDSNISLFTSKASAVYTIKWARIQIPGCTSGERMELEVREALSWDKRTRSASEQLHRLQLHVGPPLFALEQGELQWSPSGRLEPVTFEPLTGGKRAKNISMKLGCQKLERCSRKVLLYLEMGVILIFSLGPQWKPTEPRLFAVGGKCKRE